MIKITTDIHHIAVYGLGVSGMSVVRAAQEVGLSVIAWDDDALCRQEAKNIGVEIKELIPIPNVIEAIVVSPSIALKYPEPHPIILEAQEKNVCILGDMSLFKMAHDAFDIRAPIIAVTGTNGKSTVTALITHLLELSQYDVQMGGNIGRPVLDLDMPQSHKKTVYVLELSSFQLDLAQDFTADIAILLNLTPDHIDRHGSMEKYVAAKWSLFKNLSSSGVAIIGVDGERERVCVYDAGRFLASRIVRISGKHDHEADIFCHRGILYKENKSIADLSNIDSLMGVHNGQNAAAAFAAVDCIGVDMEQLESAFNRFCGLNHRLQTVKYHKGIRFVNDSKATNVEATSKALATFDNIYWIAGGLSKRKEESIKALAGYFDRIHCAYLIGDSAQDFALILEGFVSYNVVDSLEGAVSMAIVDAMGVEEAVVLFSPACASFDQFPNFAMRGEAFCAAVDKVMMQGLGV